MKRVACSLALALAVTVLAAPGLATADQERRHQDSGFGRGVEVAPHFGGVGPGFITPYHRFAPPYVVYRQPQWFWQPGFWQWNGQSWLWTPSRWVQVFPRY
jgi:hypothetical protein